MFYYSFVVQRLGNNDHFGCRLARYGNSVACLGALRYSWMTWKCQRGKGKHSQFKAFDSNKQWPDAM